MNIATIAQLERLVAVALPMLLASGFGTVIDGILSQDRFKPLVNASITFVIIALVTVVSVFATGKLTNDYAYDFLLLVGALTTLLSTSLSPLRHWLRTNVVLGATPDPLAHRSLPTTQDNDPHATQPQIVNNLQSQRYQAYINQPTAVMPTQTGYDVEVGNVINGVPARSSRPDATSGGITSNAFMPQQQQFISRIRKADNGG